MNFDIEGARKAGYSDTEIVNHLAGQKDFDIEGARKAGYKDTEILGHLTQLAQPATSPEITKEKGFAGRVAEDLATRYQNVAQEPLTVQSVATLRQPLRVAGQVAGGAWDIVGEAAKSGYRALPESVQTTIEETGREIKEEGFPIVPGIPDLNLLMKGAGKIGEGWEWFKRTYPEAAKDIEAAGNILMVAPALKPAGQAVKGGIGAVKETGAIASDIAILGKKGAKKATEGVKGAVKTTQEAILKTPPEAIEKIPVASDKAINRIVKKGINKGIRPSVAGKATFSQGEKYFDKASRAVKEIVDNKQNLQYTDETGKIISGELPKNLQQFSEAIEQTKRTVFQQYDALAKSAGGKGATVNLKPIADELETISKGAVLQDLSPSTAQYAQERAAALLKRGTYNAEEAQEAIKILNNSLETFYKNPTYDTGQRAVVDAMIVNNIRNSLDDVITQATGPGYQELKNAYGSLKTIEKEVAHRAIVDARKNVKGLLDFSDIYSGTQAIQGLIKMSPELLTQAATVKGIAKYIKMINDPNRHIREMFKLTDALMMKPKGYKSKLFKAATK